MPLVRASSFGVDGYPEMMHHSNFEMADGVGYELAPGRNGIFDSMSYLFI